MGNLLKQIQKHNEWLSKLPQYFMPEQESIEFKICCKCGSLSHISNFKFNLATTDKYETECKKCLKPNRYTLKKVKKDKCLICGGTIIQSGVGRSRKYCSGKCKNKRTVKKIIRPIVTKICKCCGKEFSGVPSRKYCSRECQNKSNSVLKKCEHCGKEFYTSYKRQRFCSVACSYQKAATELKVLQEASSLQDVQVVDIGENHV